MTEQDTLSRVRKLLRSILHEAKQSEHGLGLLISVPLCLTGMAVSYFNNFIGATLMVAGLLVWYITHPDAVHRRRLHELEQQRREKEAEAALATAAHEKTKIEVATGKLQPKPVDPMQQAKARGEEKAARAAAQAAEAQAIRATMNRTLAALRAAGVAETSDEYQRTRNLFERQIAEVIER